jgi:hypothetical protein
MSLTLGLYDVFANIVPGLVYLSLIYELSVFLKLNISYSSVMSNSFLVIGLLVLALILGHILNRVSYTLWFRRFESYGASRRIVLESLSYQHPELGFEADDAELLLAVIKHNDFELSERIESNRANGIMMRNLSFGFFLHAIVSIMFLIKDGVSVAYISYLVCSLLFCILSIQRTKDFIRWFYRDIFLETLNYGDNVSEVLKLSRRKTGEIKRNK